MQEEYHCKHRYSGQLQVYFVAILTANKRKDHIHRLMSTVISYVILNILRNYLTSQQKERSHSQIDVDSDQIRHIKQRFTKRHRSVYKRQHRSDLSRVHLVPNSPKISWYVKRVIGVKSYKKNRRKMALGILRYVIKVNMCTSIAR